MDNETSVNQELPLVTFNSLYNILRAEKKTKSLQKLPDLFYEAIEQFLHEKESFIKSLSSTDDKDQLKKEEHILKNSQKILVELLEYRSKKVSQLAIEFSLTGEEVPSNLGLLKKEEDFFNSVFKASEVFRL